MNEINIRPIEITPEEIDQAQVLRKLGWQDNYANPETGVTEELLKTSLAALPVPKEDTDWYTNSLEKEENRRFNLVAIQDGKVVGIVFYNLLENGRGDIGVFVDREYRGKGVGTKLLSELINTTTTDLEVTIFAKNKSRELYKKCGFIEEGEEGKHCFSNDVYLPIQKLIFIR